MSSELTRRDLLKAHAAGIAAATAGIALPAAAQPVPGGVSALQIKWSKAPCRFCGTGCGVMVGVKEGKVVATHGDMQAEVNRGLNCIKGYFLSKIMYGKDRLQTPLLRKKNGVYAKDGEFEPVSWDEAFDVMAAQCKRVLKEKGPTAVGMFDSGQWTIFEGYAATKLMRASWHRRTASSETAPPPPKPLNSQTRGTPIAMQASTTATARSAPTTTITPSSVPGTSASCE